MWPNITQLVKLKKKGDDNHDEDDDDDNSNDEGDPPRLGMPPDGLVIRD